MYEVSEVQPHPALDQLTIETAEKAVTLLMANPFKKSNLKPERIDVALMVFAGVINDRVFSSNLIALANYIFERPELRVDIEETINYKDLP